ncbi:MarR family transcriptional regulator [Daejeonella sp.]|uniref:MarR family winged helix-turn-helix transcriptional regulator n=1 Tax=Daejeonella sp. TaxID=2805397 RepID=UPI0030C51850
MEEPLAQALTTVTKRYLYGISKSLLHLSIDRYHYVLVLIDAHQEALSQKGLSELLHIDKSYFVSMLDYLGEKGYIIREKNPNDRREQRIKLTLKARKDLPVIRRAIEELNNLSLRNINDADKIIFAQVLRNIQDNLLDIVPKPIS